MTLQFCGIHHVSALSADIARNLDFYTRVLGLRLLKKTVNQDSPSMYHLFYGDGVGSPGSEMTFFDFPRAAREHRGSDSISLTAFRVTGTAALDFWETRLREHGVLVTARQLDGRRRLEFEDVDGTRLALVDDGGQGPRGLPWSGSDVPGEYQLRGLGFSGLTVSDPGPLRSLLEDGLMMTEVRQYLDGGHPVHVFQMGNQPESRNPAQELHVTLRPDLPRHRPGAGSVHHIALRVKDQAELRGWMMHLSLLGYPNSGEVDRHWFRSVYVTAPGGLVVELATDGPGFGIDEDMDHLGESLILPPFLEPRRAEIEARLRPLT